MSQEQNEEQRRAFAEAKKAKDSAKAAKFAKKQEQKAQAQAQPPKEKAKTLRLKEEFINPTPEGEKKDMSTPMDKGFKPAAVEAAWYAWWEKSGFFAPEYFNHPEDNEKFTMVIPPPNVTGSLHVGHALFNSLQDALVRWHRMMGHTTLWVPGTDHAGISTQSVVEKRIWREKKLTARDMGREKFLEEVWKWKDHYRNRIVSQLKRMGSSLDWSREAFTMDQNLSTAVIEAFTRLHESGLIYREKGMVNWCCALRTGISNEEREEIPLTKVVKRDVPQHTGTYEFGAMWKFAYKIDGSETDEEIIVATTRPETMLADAAVAVHPDDPRYTHLHNKHVKHPFHGTTLPIITDKELVKMEMEDSTGAVKVTPAHDRDDYKCGIRHNLPMHELYTDSGEITEIGGKEFQGMKRFDARNAVLARLKELGLYRGMKAHKMSIYVCAKTGDVIEDRLKPMWWVDCSSMAKRAKAATDSGELKIYPDADEWNRWLTNILPWCISRQLYWGHRIPAYLVTAKGKSIPSDTWVVGRTYEEALDKATKLNLGVAREDLILEQDPDVLDTWFSSGLFPFSVFGWPNQTPDLAKFYPNTFLETGKDIIFFWVIRMVMFGQQLTGQLPFKQVYLHSLVKDAQGRKMSKAKGNVIDPIDVIEGIRLEDLHKQLYTGNLDEKEIDQGKEGQKKNFPNGIPECGTDALRFSLCAYTSQAESINLDIKRVEGYRSLCNKIWNAVYFSLTKALGPNYQPPATPGSTHTLAKADEWILSRLHAFVDEANSGFKDLDFARATTACFSFWKYDLCGNYLEMLKPIFAEGTEQAQSASRDTLYTCLDMGLRLLHPFMPFITEELYQRLPRRQGDIKPSIMVTSYPIAADTSGWANSQVDKDMKLAQDIAASCRAIRTQRQMPLTAQMQAVVNAKNDELAQTLVPYLPAIKGIAFAASVVLLYTAPPPACTIEAVNADVDVGCFFV